MSESSKKITIVDEEMSNYTKEMYEAALPKLAMTEKQREKIIILGTGGELDDKFAEEFKQRVKLPSECYPGKNGTSFKTTLDKDLKNSLIIVDDNLPRPSRKSKQRNWLFRRISKIMHKAQVFLVKRKTKV